MTNDEFDRFCAEVVMQWPRLDGDWRAVIWKKPDGRPVSSDDWHPSSDLNQMREVEMAIHAMVGNAYYWSQAIQRVIAKDKGYLVTDNIGYIDILTASCEQRVTAIIAIRDEIERATNATR